MKEVKLNRKFEKSIEENVYHPYFINIYSHISYGETFYMLTC